MFGVDGENESGNSMLPAQLDDVDDDDIYIYIYITHKYITNSFYEKNVYFHLNQRSSSSCHAISTDVPYPLSPPLPINYCFQLVLRATSHISTELLYVCSNWLTCPCTSMWRGPQECIPYELIPTSPAVSRMFGSSNFDSFHDGW